MKSRRNEWRADINWLLAEMEREGLRRAGQERLLWALLHIVRDGRLRQRDLSWSLRRYITESLLGCYPAHEVRARLPLVLGITKSSACRYVSAALARRGVDGGTV